MAKKEENKKSNTLREKILPALIILIGIVGCGTLVFFGIKNVSSTNEENKTSEEHMSLEEIEQRQKELKDEELNLIKERTETFNSSGFSGDYYDIVSRLSEINEEQSELSSEKFKVEHGFYKQEKIENGAEAFISGGIYFIPAIMVLIISIVFASAIRMRSTISENAAIGTELFSSLAKEIKDKNSTYKEFKCPNCGAKLNGKEDEEECEYCGAKLHKTKK